MSTNCVLPDLAALAQQVDNPEVGVRFEVVSPLRERVRERCHRCTDTGEVGYFNSRDGQWAAEPCPVCQANEPSSASKDAVRAILQGRRNV